MFENLPNSRSQKAYLIYAIALVMMLISVAGVCVTLYSWWWFSSAKIVSAEVTGAVHGEADKLKYIVNYRDDDEQECEAEVEIFSSLIPLKVGQSVDVLYRPDNPSDIRVDRFADKWGLGIFLILWGAICSMPFWIIWVRLRKK